MLSDSPTGAPPESKIDLIVVKAILTRTLQIKLGKNFSFTHSDNPIYTQVKENQG